ncbi:MAG TPA: NAD(P)-binding domain-containing protein [Chitinophagaceae bacterium]|jgi:putative flavoprotein involved in K+ transport
MKTPEVILTKENGTKQPEQIETIIIGGGQAGLSMSYYLTKQGYEHVVLEQTAQAANSWRNYRWDSFTLVTPNWHLRLPGAEYNGSDPNGFMSKAEIVACIEQYIQRFNLPVRYNTEVIAVEAMSEQQGYLVHTKNKIYKASNVVVATGYDQHPKIPAFSNKLSPEITQLHSGAYRNPHLLPGGAVLVVGSAQSGAQITEELYRHGRKVFLCVGNAGRMPRHYRGKDITWWLDKLGFFDHTAETFPYPKGEFSSPHVSGADGGHTLNLHQFAKDGVMLLGHLKDAIDNTIFLAPDLKGSLAKADEFEATLVQMIDEYILQNKINAPGEELPELYDGYDAKVIRHLNLKTAGISTVIWATGYKCNFHFIKLPVIDNDGFPMQQRGVTKYQGLYFLGLPFLHTLKSGRLLGVGDDAAYIANHIAAKTQPKEICVP